VKFEADEPEKQFIEVFRLAALQAGALARRLQGEIKSQTKKNFTTPEGAALTAVDLAAQDVILHLLHEAFPEASIDTEEETDTVRLFPTFTEDRPLIIVDPIDGTLNYSRGSLDYAVMGAWLSQGLYRAALIHFPAWRELYWAVRDGGCWYQREWEKPAPVDNDALPSRVLITPSVDRIWSNRLRMAEYEVVLSSCSAVDSSAPATNRGSAAVSPGRPCRRRAIGFLLTTEAGGIVKIGARAWQGEDPLTFPTGRGPNVVARSSELAEKILDVLDHEE
jgi:fructose-1,6-bisphosphatase/inositol monophosphatase family enzyme